MNVISYIFVFQNPDGKLNQREIYSRKSFLFEEIVFNKINKHRRMEM